MRDATPNARGKRRKHGSSNKWKSRKKGKKNEWDVNRTDATGQPNPLVTQTPSTPAGIGLSVVVSLWALAISSFALGLAASLPLPSSPLRRCKRRGTVQAL